MKRSSFFKTMALVAAAVFAPCNHVSAQELQAKVTINHNQIQGTDASVFENLQ